MGCFTAATIAMVIIAAYHLQDYDLKGRLRLGCMFIGVSVLAQLLGGAAWGMSMSWVLAILLLCCIPMVEVTGEVRQEQFDIAVVAFASALPGIGSWWAGDPIPDVAAEAVLEAMNESLNASNLSAS